MDDARHRAMAGVSNAVILSNLRRLSERGAVVWIRYPLIPDVNDDDENLVATAAFLGSLGRRLPVYVLPYHRIGLHKYERLGISYEMSQLVEPTAERVAQVTARLIELGLEARFGG
jgi:pyruvate formate lyase activating enzyme